MMESTSSRISVSDSSGQSSKRLLFDRRYGWVIDEWKDPSEEALEGGRGMFCILPLARTLVQMASQSADSDLYAYILGVSQLSFSSLFYFKINLSATSAIKAFEKPELLQAAFNDGLQNFMSSLKNTGC